MKDTLSAVSEKIIQDMEIASLLLVNRLFTQSCRMQVYSMKDLLLTREQVVDFDHALGKIPDEDYPVQRKGLLERGAVVLRQLDVMQRGGEIETTSETEARLEAAIAERREDLSAREGEYAVEADSPDDEIEVMLANRRRAQGEKSAGFCSQCGGRVRKSDSFCPKCGAKVTQ